MIATIGQLVPLPNGGGYGGPELASARSDGVNGVADEGREALEKARTDKSRAASCELLDTSCKPHVFSHA